MIPPHERPYIPVLRQLGFTGRDEQILENVARQAPHWLSSASSASSMWVANAATVCPSADALDGKVHLTVANLNNKFHRSLEAPTTEALLRAIFQMRIVLRSTVRYPRLRYSVMKVRQTITASAGITATLAYSCLFTVVKKGMRPIRSAIRRGNPVRPARRSPD